jgi:hypothetical protein
MKEEKPPVVADVNQAYNEAKGALKETIATPPSTKRIELVRDTGIEVLQDGTSVVVDAKKGATFDAKPHVAERLVEIGAAKYV